MHSAPTCRPGTGSFYRASLNPSDYGWTLGVHGYEPVPTLDTMAPEGVLKFTSCNCHGGARRLLQEEWGHVHLSLWSLQRHYMQKQQS